MCLDLAIILTGKGYKEHHWLVIPPSTYFGYLHSHHYYTMPSSSHTILSTVNHMGIGCAAVRVCGQAGNHTNAGRAITPFMFNEEEYVSVPLATLVQTSLGLY